MGGIVFNQSRPIFVYLGRLALIRDIYHHPYSWIELKSRQYADKVVPKEYPRHFAW
jgi:hypothetical protein